jgi:hypothetical protein
VISRFFKSKKSEDEEAANAITEPQAGTDNEVNADAEASITSGRAHEEFATRRGGRRRRRTKPTAAASENNGANGRMKRLKLKRRTPNRRTRLKKQLTRKSRRPSQATLQPWKMPQSQLIVVRRRRDRVAGSHVTNENRWQSANC